MPDRLSRRICVSISFLLLVVLMAAEPKLDATAPEASLFGIFTGEVVKRPQGARFNNDDGTEGQRLTRATLGEKFPDKEIDLSSYVGRRIKVRGQWEHDWIIGADVLQGHSGSYAKGKKPHSLAALETTKAGWWIKICPEKTQCDRIDFSIGPDNDNINEHITWVKGQSPNEFDLTSNANDSKVYVYAKVSPHHQKNGYFGVCYQQTVCNKHYEFDDDEDHDVFRNDRDEWKCD